MTDLSKVDVLLGPPGTGKTTTILKRIDALLSSGIPPEEIAYCTYSKAMAAEAVQRASERFGLDPERFPWFRTIHSLAYRAMGDRQPVMTGADWKAFGESCALDFSDDQSSFTDASLNYAEMGDALRTIDHLARVMRTSVARAILHQSASGASVSLDVTPEAVDSFRLRLQAWKAEHHKIDFTDMLTGALDAEWRPPVRHAFIDEAQDNSRIMSSLGRRWFIDSSRCEGVTFAGDDDQGIHGWAGAEKGDLLWLARHAQCSVLDQSYRIPAAVHRLALRVISQNKNRVAKTFRPRDEEGSVSFADEIPLALAKLREGSALLLVRNRKFADAMREALLERGMLFSAEVGESSPLDRKDPAGAFACIAAWRAGRNASAGEFRSLLTQIPSGKGESRVLPVGTKAKADKNLDAVPPYRAREEFRIPAVVDTVLGPAPLALCLKLTETERRYCATILARDPALKGPRAILTTCHRSKGRQADHVILGSDCAYPVARAVDSSEVARESENCVAYVAATRAIHSLQILRPTERNAYPFERLARTA